MNTAKHNETKAAYAQYALSGSDGSEKQKEERRALLLDAIDEALASWDFDDAERLQIELSQM